MKLTLITLITLVCAAGSLPTQAQSDAPVKVTPETYIRAETDRQFGDIVKMAGGVNRLFHFRSPTPLDKQNVVRMNRDTLYSMGVVDTSKGATITVPELPKDRYASVYLVDNDHYCPSVIYTAGKHELPRDTKYLAIGVRIKVFNPKDADKIALVNKLQDQFIIEAGNADSPPAFKWDRESLKALTAQYEKDSAAYSSWKGMMGPRGKADEKTRHIAAAAAWGLFPEWDATYLNYSGGHDIKVGHKATYQVPENKAFWSITIYGNDGFMKSENCIVNSSNVKLNDDGTFTVYYGSKELCGDVPNRLDVTEGWNFLMRVYRPGESVLDGSYKLPTAIPVAASSSTQDPLPSWNDTASKESITSFVEKVTKEGTADFVPVPERIAVFDNDGTLWAEQPMYFQAFFIFDRIKTLAPEHPEWKDKEPFASVLKGDVKSALAGGEKALIEMAMATHAGMTSDEFEKIVSDWITTAKHPKTGKLYTEMVYQPMLEVLAYLRANGFKTFIVSGGGIEFMRPWAEKVYGVPPEQVVGSSIKTKYEVRDGKPVIVRLPELNFIDDKEGKPVGIHQHIGRRPLMAFGNSDGDFQMLEWTTSGKGPRFGMIVHHTDAEREWAYDRESHIGTLSKGLDEASAKGWTVVSMKDDWKTIFPTEK